MSLWPKVEVSSRNMFEMLYKHIGDLEEVTEGKLRFFVDAVVGSGPVKEIRYNCYCAKKNSEATRTLLFQVTTSVKGPFPAPVGTPEGDSYTPTNEEELVEALKFILARPRTSEILRYLLVGG